MLEDYDHSILEFEWNPEKSESNLAKHGFDFEDASQIFYGPVLVRQSDRENEKRWIAIGCLQNKSIAVVVARRTEVIRIISARRARKNEEREYRKAQVGRSPEGKD
jgi:uncharacterized DUF497 family protein